MNHPHVVLRTPYVAGVFEGDPGVPRLEQHGEHSLPNLNRRNLVPPNFPLLRFRLIRNVSVLKLLPKEVVQIRRVTRPEKSPIPTRFHSLHE